MEKYIEQGKDFIENELYYSFNSMETKTFAKRLLKAFTKGFELAKTYWQKGMFTQQQIDEMLDHQVCITTAQMLGKANYSEEEVKELVRKSYNYGAGQMGFYLTHNIPAVSTIDKWFEENKKKNEKDIT